MISNASIDKLRDLSITEVVTRYGVSLKKGVGCCPIHNEKTPSFNVKENKGFFKCFGCGAGGDVIKFVELHDKVDFIEAVERLAKMFVIELDYEKVDKEQLAQQRAERKNLRDVLTHAHQQYCTLLFTDKGAQARDYIFNVRGYTEDMVNEWGIGYAPDEWRFLSDMYSREGLLPNALKLGLVREKDDKRCYDFFRGRLMFPIYDERGELVTMAGRVITEDKEKGGKYINGPDSELYHKSQILYGMYQASKHIQERDYAILVEGYFDVISSHAAGANNTVGICGTAFTPEHAKLIKKYTSNVIIMLDGDKQGIDKITSCIKTLLTAGMKAEVMQLSGGKDPDNYSRQFFNLQNEPIMKEIDVITERPFDDDIYD